jgi:hypothetical protein
VVRWVGGWMVVSTDISDMTNLSQNFVRSLFSFSVSQRNVTVC